MKCTHVPTSEGQSMCTCEDHRMMLELLIEMQARYIVYLEKRFQQGEVKNVWNQDLG